MLRLEPRSRALFRLCGSVIDLGSPNDPKPSRLDFFGDELESIREIDPGLQRSGAKKDLFALGPARLIEPGPDLAQSNRSKLLELGNSKNCPVNRFGKRSTDSAPGSKILYFKL